MSSCQVSNFQEPASAVPGNIGIVKGKVLIWDHDPMLGRSHQHYTFPFSQTAEEQLRDEVRKIRFQLNSVFLEPILQIQDMWVGTRKPTGIIQSSGDGSGEKEIFQLDLVPCPEARDRLPFGSTWLEDGRINDLTGRSIFPHQIWVHIGNLLKRGVPLHPSEYDIDLSGVTAASDLVGEITNPSERFSKFTLAELQSAPKWEYRERVDGDTGTKAYWPVMVSKKTSSSAFPVHWTLEKIAPVWQGQDMFFTFKKGDQDTDDSLDSDENDIVDTNFEEYKYLLFDPETKPTGSTTLGDQTTESWVDGISNEAFYLPPSGGNNSNNNPSDRFAEARKAYWWKFKTYLLIEIGVGHPDHNYFIELVKGRSPRFLHLGREWDNTKRLQDGVIATAADWTFIRKCRVLSEYTTISCDELFRKDEFTVSIRNHLGRMVITFQGLENQPWVVTRLDNDSTRFDYTKVLIPMVVPPSRLRLHGGNISCQAGYSPMRYTETASIRFTDRQVDSFEATNDDLWITFASIGNSIKHENPQVKRQFFDDPRFALQRIGYELDSFSTVECHKNKLKVVPVYDIYNKQYTKYGKGFVNTFIPIDPITGTGGRHVLINVLAPRHGGRPHQVIIENARNPGRPFQFSLSEEADISYPYKEHTSRWDINVRLKSGSVNMPPLSGVDAELLNATAIPTNNEKLFRNYVTPIVTSWNLIILGGAKPFEGKVEPFDIAPLVNSINDSWSAEGFTTINHEMNIRCYIPDSMLPISSNPGLSTISLSDNINLHALGQKLLKLHKQAFYVTVSYWWENGVGERDAPGNSIQRRTPPRDSDLLIQMTGIAYGGTLEKSVNKLFMDFTVKDYTSILDHQFIFNSPFFDGVNDALAIYELAKLAGFDDNPESKPGVDRRPLGFLQRVISDPRITQCESFRYNGEETMYRSFDLPGSFADLANPSVRFQNGETYLSAMIKIAQLATKVLYFDRWGVLRFENSPAIEAAFQAGEELRFRPKFNFVTTPFRPRSTNGTQNEDTDFVFDPNRHVSHLVWNVVRYSRSVEDCINQIVLFTASNDIVLEDGSRTGGFIIEGYTFFDQIFDPAAEGFLGFRKPFYQSNGMFGGIEGVRLGVQHYAKMKFPPATINFQTYGVPGLKPLDIVALDGNLFYITEIVHEIDPSSNNWWMNITGEWLKPFLGDLGFLQDYGSTDSDPEGNGE